MKSLANINSPNFTTVGKILSSDPTCIKATLPGCFIGELVEIESPRSYAVARAFTDNKVVLQPISNIDRLVPYSRVRGLRKKASFKLAAEPFGQIFNALGEPLKCSSEDKNYQELEIEAQRLSPTSRVSKTAQLETGIKAIDQFTPLGLGQRVVVIAPPGCGKSTLLTNLTKSTGADIVVTALIGERGREVQSFYEKSKQLNSSAKQIIISSTADENPIKKVLAGKAAFSVAEHYSNEGANVLLLFDSLTRYLRALRDVGLASGELPIRQGYPASVFDDLPKLIERAGNYKSGSITAVLTMLSNNSIDEDPMLNEVMGVVDGHIRLRPDLAQLNHYPAIDIADSLSRFTEMFKTNEESKVSGEFKKIFTEHFTSSLLSSGEQHPKSSALNKFLVQDSDSYYSLDESSSEMRKLIEL